MPATIQEFVQQLRTEGVEAGRTEAQKIIDEANASAQQILAQARAEGETAKAALVTEGQRLKDKRLAELTLACRDLVLRVKDNLKQSVEFAARAKVDAHARDPEFVKAALLALIQEHASPTQVTVTTNAKTAEALQQWARAEAVAVLRERGVQGLLVRPGLKGAGFELSRQGDSAVTEVTTDAIVDAIKDLVSPELGRLLDGVKVD